MGLLCHFCCSAATRSVRVVSFSLPFPPTALIVEHLLRACIFADAYMAPELMFDNPYGTSADMFSFGIVLWETIYRQKVRGAFTAGHGTVEGGGGENGS